MKIGNKEKYQHEDTDWAQALNFLKPGMFIIAELSRTTHSVLVTLSGTYSIAAEFLPASATRSQDRQTNKICISDREAGEM